MLAQNAAAVCGVQPHTLVAPPPPHVWGDAHVPHETVRETPHVSLAVMEPQVAPALEQKAAVLPPVQPHAFAVPPPPHVSGDAQAPQEVLRANPQLSVPTTVPQVAPWAAQKAAVVCGVQPQTFAFPLPPQVWGEVHAPQLAVRTRPQLSLPVTEPQLAPDLAQNAASGSEIQPQTFAVPPPAHVCGELHPPHDVVRGRPQLSVAVTVPQVAPWAAQKAAVVCGVQPQTFALPLPPQVVGDAHVPQSTVRATPQLSLPVTDPQLAPELTQKVAVLSLTQPQTLAVPPPPQLCGVVHDPHEAVTV